MPNTTQSSPGFGREDGILPRATNRQQRRAPREAQAGCPVCPAEVLDIAEWLDDHPNAPADFSWRNGGWRHAGYGQPDAHGTIRIIAGHPDFTGRCVARLWKAALLDHRPTNQLSRAPRRRFEDLLSTRQSDGNHHAGCTSDYRVSARTTSRCRSQGGSPWAVSGLALRYVGWGMEQVETGSDNMGSSPWPSISSIADRRRNIMEGLKRIAWFGRLAEAKVALQSWPTAVHSASPITAYLRRRGGCLATGDGVCGLMHFGSRHCSAIRDRALLRA